MDLKELNETIKQQELKILEKEETLKNLKINRDTIILIETIALEKEFAETKDKELSTIQKRELRVKAQPTIKKFVSDVEKLEYELKVLKIEQYFNIREFHRIIAMNNKVF